MKADWLSNLAKSNVKTELPTCTHVLSPKLVLYRRIIRSMYSLDAQARRERAEALEKEREEVGLALRDTRSRVKKYDRLKKRIKTKVT